MTQYHQYQNPFTVENAEIMYLFSMKMIGIWWPLLIAMAVIGFEKTDCASSVRRMDSVSANKPTSIDSSAAFGRRSEVVGIAVSVV